ncbi:hypothetical protein [Anthocerotibacter panamensis]|uniref:hypothetical protein n=1 Tax=Anthocerotibacter panamensis TaxID=2857077 RepID=UPI001C4034E3|nr:hypothetical protein [Anthocerotibacter panamensis]
METQIVYTIPNTALDCLNAQFIYEETDLILKLEYEDEDGMVRSYHIRFIHAQLFRFENEMHCISITAGAYDGVVELVDSAWAMEINSFENEYNRHSPWSKRHFCIYISSTGQLNIIADSFTVEVVK